MIDEDTVKGFALFRAILFIVAIVFVIYHFAMTLIVGNIVATPAIASNAHAVAAFNSVSNVTSRLDYIFFAFFIALSLGMIIASWFIVAYPIAVILYFFVIAVSVIVSAVMSNVFGTITSMPVFATTMLAFPMMSSILNRLPVYLCIIAFASVIVMFIKVRKEENG